MTVRTRVATDSAPKHWFELTEEGSDKAQLAELLADYAERRTVDGKAGVARNGYLPAREIQS